MKLLVVTLPLAGHTAPTATLVRGLLARGHTVRWMTGYEAQATVEASGAEFISMLPLPDCTPASLRDWALRCERLRGAQQIAITNVLEGEDAILADPTITGAESVWLDEGTPYVCLGILPLIHARADWPLVLQATTPDMEYRRPEYKNVAFIGPLVPQPPVWEPPLWWTSRSQKPLVFVTQGTLATDPTALILPALEGLAELPVQVVAACDPAKLPSTRIPANATLTPFIPYDVVIPASAAVVTNGGYVGVQTALMAGVPMLVAGETEEKGEIAARVAYAGNGIDLGTGHPSAAQVQAGMLALGNTPRFSERAYELHLRAQATDAPMTAALLLEHLVPHWRKARAEAA